MLDNRQPEPKVRNGKILRKEKKAFPIKCHIYTDSGNIISWTRSIRAWQEMQGFQALIEKMELEGKIEKK